LILCGTLGIAFAPHLAAAKDAVCVRTSHGTVVCGQTVAGRDASPRQHYQTRQLFSKQSWASRDHTSRYSDEGTAAKKDYRGHPQSRAYERAGSDYFRKAGHQTTTVDRAKRTSGHEVYGDRPRELASRERGVEIFTDRNHKPVNRAGSHNVYVEPQKTKRGHSSQQVDAAPRGSRNVVYRAPSHSQAKRVRTRQDVDDAGHPSKGGDQVDDHPDQGDQDQPDRN
jgi:hypothetical protein